MNQNGATLVFDVPPEKISSLEDVLASGTGDLDGVEGLHYASFSLLPLGGEGETCLLVELNFDGAFPDIVAGLSGSRMMTDCLKEIGITSQIERRLRSANLGAGYLYVAMPGAGLRQIEADNKLLMQVRARRGGVQAGNAREVVEALRCDDDVRLLIQQPTAEAGSTPVASANLLSVLFNILGYLITGSLLVSSLSPVPGLRGAMIGVVMLLATFCLGGGLVGLLAGTSRMVLAISVLAMLAAVTVMSVAAIVGDIPALVWVYYYILLAAFVGLGVLGISMVPKTSRLDRHVRAAVLTLSIGVTVLLLVANLGGPFAIAAGMLLFALSTITILAAMFVLKDNRPLVLGLAAGIPLAIAISGIATGWLHLVLCTLALALVLVPAAAIMLLCRLEANESGRIEKPPVWNPDQRGHEVLRQEATRGQSLNHLLSVTRIRPGRKWMLQLTLIFIMWFDKMVGTRGELSGITTIHFARWIIVGDNLVFLSNYDHAWGAYLDEFIDQARRGLTSIWTHTEGFPLTHWLVGGGAAYAQRFKSFARQSQYPHAVHYGRYPNLTVEEMLAGEAVRQILASDEPSDTDCEYVARIL